MNYTGEHAMEVEALLCLTEAVIRTHKLCDYMKLQTTKHFVV